MRLLVRPSMVLNNKISLPQCFKGRRMRTRQDKKYPALPTIQLFLWVIHFHSSSKIKRLLKRKENSSSSIRWRYWVRFALPLKSTSWYRNINLFPFQLWKSPFKNKSLNKILTCKTALAYALGPTNSCRNALHTKPFSTSVFKVLIWIFATTTKICTIGRFRQFYNKSFNTTYTPSYSPCLRIWHMVAENKSSV